MWRLRAGSGASFRVRTNARSGWRATPTSEPPHLKSLPAAAARPRLIIGFHSQSARPQPLLAVEPKTRICPAFLRWSTMRRRRGVKRRSYSRKKPRDRRALSISPEPTRGVKRHSYSRKEPGRQRRGSKGYTIAGGEPLHQRAFSMSPATSRGQPEPCPAIRKCTVLPEERRPSPTAGVRCCYCFELPSRLRLWRRSTSVSPIA
jgi:hypothetical protein